MGDYTLRPGLVGTYAFSDVPAVIVGDPPQWSDDSDASYAQAVSINDLAVDSSPAAFIDLSDFIEITSATVRWRIRMTNTDSTHERSRLMALEFYSSDYLTFFREEMYLPVNDDSIQEPSWTGGADWIAPYFAKGGLGVNFWALNYFSTAGGEQIATIYEVWLDVVGTLRNRTTPPLRIFPRSDALTGGAPRVLGHSRTNQASNRTIGGHW